MKRLVFFMLMAVAVSPSFAQNREVVSTDGAPKAIGPYSQAVTAGNMVFASGQLGMDPATGNFVEGGIAEQTRQSLDNLRAVLEAAGCSLENVVSCTVYMKNLDDFATMNGIYAEYFAVDPPSRATVQVARLPKDGLIEISCIAVKP